MRSQILPGNSLRMLQANDEGGVITINEERDYHFRYELADLYVISRLIVSLCVAIGSR